MTFSFAYDFTVNLNRVRFETGDIDPLLPIYADEAITAFLVETDDRWQAAVIMALEGEVARLRRVGKFKADWLEVDPAGQLKAAMALLEKKRAEYGLVTPTGTINTGAAHVYRQDSLATEEPDYQE